MNRWLTLGVGCMVVAAVTVTELEGCAEAFALGQLELTSGAVNWDGRQGRILDRLLDQNGALAIGAYQSMTEIVDPLVRGHKTYSLFTSGLNGVPAPSAAISGSSITVDLSSLYFGWTRGSEIHAVNIGGVARGLFNPETSEFSLSWNHLFENHAFEGNSKQPDESGHQRVVTFFLQGTVVGPAPAPVPLPAALVLFASGFAGIGGLAWRSRRIQRAGVSV